MGELGAQPPYRRFRLAPFALAVLEIGVGGLELIGEPLLLLDRRQHGERSAVKLHADGEEQLGRGKGGEAEDDIIEIAGEDQAPGQRAIDRHGPAECDAGAEMIAKAGGGGAERDHDQRQVDERIVRRQQRPRGHEAHPGADGPGKPLEPLLERADAFRMLGEDSPLRIVAAEGNDRQDGRACDQGKSGPPIVATSATSMMLVEGGVPNSWPTNAT